MPKVEALCDVPFGVGVQPRGAVFEATQQEANLLVALKRVRVVKQQAVEKAPEVAAKVDAPVVEKADRPAAGRNYNRRDMQAGK